MTPTRRIGGARAAAWALAAITVACVVGCSTNQASAVGGLEVIVTTVGLSAPTDFDDIHLQVSQQVDGGGWNKLWDDNYPVSSSSETPAFFDASSPEVTLPATFAVLTGKSTDQEVLVTVTALKGGPTGKPIVLVQAQVQAPADRLAALWMVLAQVCEGQVTTTGPDGQAVSTCPMNQTCQPTTGACGSDVIADAAALPNYEPGDLDAAFDAPILPNGEGGVATPDAEVEAAQTTPVDSGPAVGPTPADSGVDATVDSGPAVGPPRDSGVDATIDSAPDVGPTPGDSGLDAPIESGTVAALTPCTTDLQCQTGEVCLGSLCQNSCGPDAGCPTNWFCGEWFSADGGVAGSRCAPHCNPLSPQLPDSTHVACPARDACFPNLATNGYPGFTYCVGNINGTVGTGGSCVDGTQCEIGDGCFTPGICRPYCTVGTSSCGLGTCESFGTPYYDGLQELGFCNQTCSSGSDCLMNWTCNDVIAYDGGIAGTCYPTCNPVSPQQSDSTHVACPAGERCDILAAAEGPAFTECSIPGTVATGGSCTGNNQCVAGDGCFGTPGVCRSYCRVGTSDCGTAICESFGQPYYDGTQQFGFCNQPCATNTDCGSNEFCWPDAQECVATCSSDSDCATNGMCNDYVDNDGGVAGSFCSLPCHPLSPQLSDSAHVACTSEETCGIFYDPLRQRSYTLCETVSGTSGAGQTCSSTSDCSVGTNCVSWGTVTECSAYCAVSSGNCGASIPCVGFVPARYDDTTEIGVCNETGHM